jgi:hypothetical protein
MSRLSAHIEIEGAIAELLGPELWEKHRAPHHFTSYLTLAYRDGLEEFRDALLQADDDWITAASAAAPSEVGQARYPDSTEPLPPTSPEDAALGIAGPGYYITATLPEHRLACTCDPTCQLGCGGKQCGCPACAIALREFARSL